MATSNKKLTTKDAYIILKAVEKEAKRLYDDKSDRFVAELVRTSNEQYRSIYGLLHTRTNSAKTTKIYTKEEQLQINEIDAQIAKLQAKKDKLGATVEVKASYKSLVAELEQPAKDYALEIIKEITGIIDSKTLENAINKAASKTARMK